MTLPYKRGVFEIFKFQFIEQSVGDILYLISRISPIMCKQGTEAILHPLFIRDAFLYSAASAFLRPLRSGLRS